MKTYLELPPQRRRIRVAANGGRAGRVRSWRRRVLLRRGALKRAAMSLDAENCWLAMLDEDGVVVSWNGPADDGPDHMAEQVVDRHVTQFYVPEDIAHDQPRCDLRAATIAGNNRRQGWLRRPDGVAFWGTAVIEAIVLRDGRLQGFSYLICGCDGPNIIPAWDRVARSHSETP